MIHLSNPLFLWALAGLSIPIGIHLLSRKEGKILRLGSLRHVQETSTQQFKGIRLNEKFLLLLRCLMVLLLTLILSGLSLKRLGNSKWLLVEKSLMSQPRLKLILDSLQREGYESHLLAENFPLLKDTTPEAPTGNYWRLMENLKHKNVSEVIVFAQSRAGDFKGLRPSLPAHVRWISQPLPSHTYILQTTQITNDSLLVRTGHASATETYFTSKKEATQNSTKSDFSPLTLSILMVYDEQYAYDQTIIKASLRSIEKLIPIKIQLDIAHAPPTSIQAVDACFWLSDEAIPPSEEGKIIYLKPLPGKELFVREKANKWRITRRLDEEVALKENMTLQIASLIIPSDELWKAADVNDRRTVPDAMAWSDEVVKPESQDAGFKMEPANSYLLALLFLLLCVERNVAYKRNQ